MDNNKSKLNETLNPNLINLLIQNFKLRMQKATQQLNNVSKIRQSKKEIAKYKTKLNNKL